MAARKKKAPARKARTKPSAAKKRAAPRELPNDAAWRELVETALEKPDPVAKRGSGASASRADAAKKKKPARAKK
jgi:hypothetical protein